MSGPSTRYRSGTDREPPPRRGRDPRRADDRGVSTAVNHVLAIGITAILISGLIATAAGILNDQRRDATRKELTTIGNRLADQVAAADRIVDAEPPSETVTFRIEQPSRVAGQTYTVELVEDECNDPVAQQPNSESTNYCIVLFHEEARGGKVEVPVEVDGDVESGPVTLTLKQVGTGEFVIEATDP